MTTVRDLLERGTWALARKESAEAPEAPEALEVRRDAQVLLMHALGFDRAALYSHPERAVTAEQQQRFLALIERRKRGEPVAYLTGEREFYGLPLFVDRRVLIPRPETEFLVEEALKIIRQRLANGQTPLVADIGTGSGAIPIAIAVEEPRLPLIYACDISPDALAVARLNCQRHHVETRVKLLQGDLVAPLPEPVDLLLANLPYVGTEEIELLTPDVRNYEPSLALFSGPDGLVLLRRFCLEVRQFDILKPGGVVVLEIGYQQRQPLTQLLHELWPQAGIIYKQDYAGLDRIVQVAT